MMALFKKIDRWLLPRTEEFQYGPYLWLVYLLMFFISLMAYHPIKYSYWYAAIGTMLFLVVYFNAYWASRKHIHWHIIVILIIGSFLAVLTTGAAVFFVYAAAFCHQLGNRKKAFFGLIFIVLWIVTLTLWWGHSMYFYLPAIFFTCMVGGLNIYQHDLSLKRKELALSQNEVRHLARISERERIARDLHDVIGHTFSVITLKAELSKKLIDKNPKKAREEIAVVEDISRKALKQVREVVSGYRTSDLSTELAHAKYLLESNDIHFEYTYEVDELSDKINKELAIILKELITNVLKHAQADQVSASVIHNKDNNDVTLCVKDNGQGFESQDKAGFGLKGIDERVNQLSGRCKISSEHGVMMSITVPLGEQHD